MFDIKIIASGSSGNAYLIKDGWNKLLVECGIEYPKLKEALDFKTPELDGCLISHEHRDHSRCARQVARTGICMVMSEGTREAINLDPTFTTVVRSEIPQDVGPWKILPFDVEHDSAEPLGFLILSPSGKKILYATDTAYLRYRFKGVSHYLIEANYCEKFLVENVSINEYLKNRIRRSHFEIGNCIEFLRSCDLSATEKIHLLHLSNDNADRAEFVNRVQEATGIPAY